MILTKDEFVEELKTGVHQVGFNKVNGEFRDMTCTLMENKIPPRTSNGSKRKKYSSSSSNAVRVYDLNAEGWRSFLPENVLSFSKVG